jgi:hypothetical protein
MHGKTKINLHFRSLIRTFAAIYDQKKDDTIRNTTNTAGNNHAGGSFRGSPIHNGGAGAAGED